jgi:predicted alpha/beta hydrolase family esterase
LNALSDFRVLLMPGLHGSGAQHWQSRWQRLHPAFERVVQEDWSDPQLALWSRQLDLLRARDARPALIVAHSFGCLATVHSVARNGDNVAGLLLVAPADPDKFGVAALLPQVALDCPSLMIASSDDPWISAPRAVQWARRWGSTFVDAGALGHINAESGLEDWPDGLARLQALAELARRPAPG